MRDIYQDPQITPGEVTDLERMTRLGEQPPRLMGSLPLEKMPYISKTDFDKLFKNLEKMPMSKALNYDLFEKNSSPSHEQNTTELKPIEITGDMSPEETAVAERIIESIKNYSKINAIGEYADARLSAEIAQAKLELSHPHLPPDVLLGDTNTTELELIEITPDMGEEEIARVTDYNAAVEESNVLDQKMEELYGDSPVRTDSEDGVPTQVIMDDMIRRAEGNNAEGFDFKCPEIITKERWEPDPSLEAIFQKCANAPDIHACIQENLSNQDIVNKTAPVEIKTSQDAIIDLGIPSAK